MSRNDQAIRHWYLLRRLESTRGLTLQELGDALPEDYRCHPRTLRRDLEALEVSFPIYTDQVGGQTRWRLIEGFHDVPALAFSPTELMALVLSRDLLKPLDGTHIKASLDSVFNKATSVLPPEALAYIRVMQGYFSVGLGPHKNYREHKETIERLSRAISRKRTVQMRYYSASRDATSRRDVDPYHLWYTPGALYLVGYCHLRRDVLLFAVDRIRSLTITNRPCQMPLGFDLEAYLKDALVAMRGEPIEVELVFDSRTAAWARDRQWHPSQRVEMRKGGGMRMFLHVSDTPELVGWILNFGSGVRVVRPDHLREKILEEAKRIVTSSVTPG
ncbi:MAG TPA: WYL domain-containing protein [Acidobacteriota bacterium]|nr:WYL domain-containing protein [Acidobacteriota bacterium]